MVCGTGAGAGTGPGAAKAAATRMARGVMDGMFLTRSIVRISVAVWKSRRFGEVLWFSV